MLTGFDNRSVRLDRFFDRFANLDSFKPQLNLPPHQPRDIKQIIDEAGHVARLPVNRIDRLGWADPSSTLLRISTAFRIGASGLRNS